MAFIQLEDCQKDMFIKRIQWMIEIYEKKLATQFANIDQEAKQFSDQYFESKNAVISEVPLFDSADIAMQAFDIESEYYQNLDLMQHTTYMMTLATLYQVWEQQLRRFLYEDLIWREYWPLVDDDGKAIEFRNFMTDSNQIVSLFKYSNWPLTDLEEWIIIQELRLVQNVIKHGEGNAAESLKRKRPDFINDQDLGISNKKLLAIPENEITRYKDAIIRFWEKMPKQVEFQFPEYQSKISGPLTLQQDPITGHWLHVVADQPLKPDENIEVRYGKKKWIEGTYSWSGHKEEMATLRSLNSADVLYIEHGHLVRVLETRKDL